MAKIEVGGIELPSKRAAIELCRIILHGHSIGETVADPGVHAFLLALLAKHRRAAQKIGAGVASFQVEATDFGSRTRGFWITRVDGTRTDFSFLRCLTPGTPRKDALRALRHEIQPQIDAFRESLRGRPLTCSVTNVGLSWMDMHVDHNPTFASLVEAFLDAAGVALEDIALLPPRDGEIRRLIADRNIAERWRAFHADRARLRPVHRTVNLSTLRKGGA